MSLIPLLFSDWWDQLDHPHSLAGQDFGLGIRPDQLQLEHYIPRQLSYNRRQQPQAYYRPWGELLRRVGEAAGSSTVKADKNKFQVILDVQQFSPDEIDVKVVDKFVVVEAKHEEKPDEHGFISRQFVRKYMIPEQCDIDQVQSSLSSDGVLTISAPRKDLPKVEGERAIKIEHTGKPAIRDTCQKECKKDAKKDEKKVEKK